jgi:hypothetical protein
MSELDKSDSTAGAGDVTEQGAARQDLSFLLPMIDRIRAGLAALEADVAAIKQVVENAANIVNAGETAAATPSAVPAEISVYPAPSWSRHASVIGSTVALLLLAHWLIVFVYDLRTIVLLLASILIPLSIGILFTFHRQIAPAVQIGVGVATGLIAVFAMSYVTSMFERTPVVPQNTREWIETLQYVASITFAYVTGILLNTAWHIHAGTGNVRMSDKTLRVARALAQKTGETVDTGAKVGKRVKGIHDLINYAILPAASAITSVVTGANSILK